MANTINILCQQITPKLHHWLSAAPPLHTTLQITAAGSTPLTHYNLNRFDQIWLFGDSLTSAEQQALFCFFKRGGGVYLAAASNHPHTQAITKPTIRPQQYYDWSYPGHHIAANPHPLLQDGINQITLDAYTDTKIDLAAVYQHTLRNTYISAPPQPAVQAWLCEDQRRRPILVTHNSHPVNNGRLIADVISPTTELLSYYRNIALWLMPQAKQQRARNQMLWDLSQQWLIQNCDLERLPPYLLGAIGRHLCQDPFLTDWLTQSIPYHHYQRLARYGLINLTHPPLIDLSSPLEELILGEVLWALYHHPLPTQPNDQTMNQLVATAVTEALQTFEPQVQRVRHWLNNDAPDIHPTTNKAADQPPFAPLPPLYKQAKIAIRHLV